MKMRRFLTKKKKKSSNVDSLSHEQPLSVNGITTSNIVDPYSQKTNVKRRLFRKHKPKNQKSTESDEVPDSAIFGKPTKPLQVPNNTDIVLRKAAKENEYNNNQVRSKPRYRKPAEQRVPDSVSSSRTPSSASSASSQRWSSRRPRSLVETFRNQSPADHSEYTNGNLSDHVTTDVLKIPTGEEKENRGFLSDFLNRRHFKRSSSSSRTSSTARPLSFVIDNERLSFRLKNSKFSKNSLNNRRSWHYHNQTFSGDTSKVDHSHHPSKTFSKPVSRSFTEDTRFHLKTHFTQDLNCTPLNSVPSQGEKSSSETCSSHSSVSTVISAKNLSEDFAEVQSVTTRKLDTNSDDNRSSACFDAVNNDCDKISVKDPPVQRSFKPLAYKISLNDDRITRKPFSSTATSLDTLDNSISTGSFFIGESRKNFCNLENPYEVRCNGPSLKNTNKFGGSLIDLTKFLISQCNSEDDCTLTRQNVANYNKNTSLSSRKGASLFASSPQLNNLDFKVKKKVVKTKDTRQDNCGTFSVANRNKVSLNNVVDSPIKRAIGFPGVVLRRHRQIKQSDPRLIKSSSSDLLSRKTRAKQVLSLNLEDLQSYDQMKNKGLQNTNEGRQFAILYPHRYISNVTSIDSLRRENFFDEDEFLNLLLSQSNNTVCSQDETKLGQSEEPTSKRVKTLRKSVVSFANLISPGKPKSKIQRSSSFKESIVCKPYRPPGSSYDGSNNSSTGAGSQNPGGKKRGITKGRNSQLWHEIYDGTGLDEVEIKRQESIFEVFQGESDMVLDLKMAKQTYRDSMMTLKMLSEDEVCRIFGKLDCLLPLHEDLIARLEAARASDGKTDEVGHVFIDWFPTLSPYNEYCANQADAKETLDKVIGREKKVRDFLQRCLESPFSRKLDLWSYLDLPRSRLVKYPLLLKAILKVTPSDHPDAAALDKSLLMINEIIKRVDDLTGERQCKFVKSKLEYLDEKKKCPEVESSRKIICSGQLKSSRGNKLQVFLFDRALVLTRNATRREKLTYQIYRQPLPLKSLIVETEEGGKLSGSFRGGILTSDKNAKHSFRVRSEQLNITYTLTATDEHDKKQWINSLLEAISNYQSENFSVHRSKSCEKTVTNDSSSQKQSIKKKQPARRSSSLKSGKDKSNDLSNSGSSHKSKKPPRKISIPDRLKRNGSATEDYISTDLDLLKVDQVFDDKPQRLSRSLTASPVNVNNLPNKKSGRSRSVLDSSLKPSGRILSSTILSGQTSTSKTPSLRRLKSAPDLFAFLAGRSPAFRRNSRDALHLTANDFEKPTKGNFSPISIPYLSDLSHLIIDSPDHPAPSNTSQNFPIVEEDALGPAFKSLSSLNPALASPTISVSFPSISPIASYQSVCDIQRKSETDLEVFSRTSSESLGDVPHVVNDVDMILESAEDDEGIRKSVGLTFSHCSLRNNDPSIIDDDDVANLLNNIISQVCHTLKKANSCDSLFVACNEHFITVTSDDGTPWCGDTVEMSI